MATTHLYYASFRIKSSKSSLSVVNRLRHYYYDYYTLHLIPFSSLFDLKNACGANGYTFDEIFYHFYFVCCIFFTSLCVSFVQHFNFEHFMRLNKSKSSMSAHINLLNICSFFSFFLNGRSIGRWRKVTQTKQNKDIRIKSFKFWKKNLRHIK